jgi:hypothetical protein
MITTAVSTVRAGPVYISCTARKTGCGIAGAKAFDVVSIRSNRVDCGKC